MNSLSTQKSKPRKMKAVVKKSRFQVILDLFYRVIEITVVVVTVAKLCYQLVIMFEDSGLTRFLINRHLAFLLGNAIVISIVAKCGLFANQEPDAPRRNTNEFYDEFVRESSRREQRVHTDLICREKQSSEDKEQSREEQSMLENRAKQSTQDKREEQSTDKKDITVKRCRQIITQTQESPRKSYERSGSENLEGSKKSSCGRLKRSETVDVSDDELRYKIESFIAKQRRNQKDEEFCIV